MSDTMGLTGAAALSLRERLSRALPIIVLAPSLAASFIYVFVFAIWTFYISLSDSSLLPSYGFVGFEHYVALWQNARWKIAYSNLFLFSGLYVVLAIIIGLGLAIAIDQRVRGEAIWRTIFLYPLSISFIVTGLTWQWVLSPTIGVQNFVRGLGWSDFVFDWIVRPDRAIYTLVFAGVWHQSGLIMAIMLAGLRGIDREIWRATRIEAIPTWRVYLSIVLPMLRPLLVTCVVLIAIAVVRSYDLVVAMTGGGPGYASDLPGKFVVDFAFERANIGQASAAAAVMLGSVLTVLAPYLYLELSRRER